MIELISKSEAKERGLTHYRTGKPCKRGHLSSRYVRTSNCVACSRMHGRDAYRANPTKAQRKKREYYENNLEKKMLVSAKERARKYGVDLHITPDDITIPDVCPVLGIPIECQQGRMSDNSPTLDRIRPEDGYVPGNVAVISAKANRIKNNASLEDLIAVARWVRAHTNH